jgi:hypothetical protein
MTQQREDWAAELACQYIEATLNVPVETWDRYARQGAHDLQFDHEGRSIAVEVKLVVDADYRALEKRIAKTGYVRDSRLTRMWDLRLKHRARVDQAQRLMSAMPSCSSGGNTWSPCCCTREKPASFQQLHPSSQNRSMDYGLQASRRRHESSPGFLTVGGSKVAGGQGSRVLTSCMPYTACPDEGCC